MPRKEQCKCRERKLIIAFVIVHYVLSYSYVFLFVVATGSLCWFHTTKTIISCFEQKLSSSKVLDSVNATLSLTKWFLIGNVKYYLSCLPWYGIFLTFQFCKFLFDLAILLIAIICHENIKMFMTDFYHVKMAGLNGGVGRSEEQTQGPVLLRKVIVQ
jgi:hypothetical protein